MKKLILGQNNIRSNEDGSVEIGNVANYLQISNAGDLTLVGQ